MNGRGAPVKEEGWVVRVTGVILLRPSLVLVSFCCVTVGCWALDDSTSTLVLNNWFSEFRTGVEAVRFTLVFAESAS